MVLFMKKANSDKIWDNIGRVLFIYKPGGDRKMFH